ncbi:MAG: hypothetical protein U0637_11110 [Phycisphaerales bacterium]
MLPITTARRRAALEYRPATVRLLIVAEAPPCTPERYFYFGEVDKHDWLFRYVWEGLTGDKPDRTHKPAHLAALRDAGVFMIDLHEDPISRPTAKDLRPCVPGLLQRCSTLRPSAILLIKSVVYDVAFEPLRAAGLPAANARIPFPASGQQKKFLDAFRAALPTPPRVPHPVA